MAGKSSTCSATLYGMLSSLDCSSYRSSCVAGYEISDGSRMYQPMRYWSILSTCVRRIMPEVWMPSAAAEGPAAPRIGKAPWRWSFRIWITSLTRICGRIVTSSPVIRSFALSLSFSSVCSTSRFVSVSSGAPRILMCVS